MNKIYNCDIMEGFKHIPDSCIDLIVTSPPYNFGIKYDSWDDNMPWEEYLEWCSRWLKECYRVLKDDGRMCLNHYFCSSDERFPLVDLYNIQKELGFNLNKFIIWDDPTLHKATAWGSWMSASSPYIQNPFEGILISYKNQWAKQNKGKSTISKEEFINSVHGVWKMKPQTKQKTIANFPLELPTRCINLLTYENDLVLDPFMGSGTTAVACIQTSRKYVGFEISPNYYKIAYSNIKDAYGRKHATVQDLFE